jgi:adenosylmethionine-8-amino-7-oxononanoate aminotransferase
VYRFPGSEEECSRASLAEVEALFEAQARRIACLIVEPLVQAAAGMRVMPAGFLAALEGLCREHDVLLFADEVATGFGRTGELFACEHERVEPDLMSLGKGLTGGYLPVAATLASDAIYDAFYGDFTELKALYHGHSFTGNQLGCAVALASLDLFERDQLVAHVRDSSRLVARELQHVAALPHVGDVRQRGLMVGIELVADRATKEPFDWRERTGQHVCVRARELGMITRPLGDVVVFMPPLASEREDLDAMLSILAQAISDVTGA